MSKELIPLPSAGNGILINLAEGQRALAEARTLFAAKRIRDVAAAAADLLGELCKQQQISWEAVLDAFELKLWAEHKVGEFLRHNVRAGRPLKLSQDTTFLPDHISRDQSSRWQKVSRIPPPKLQAYIDGARKSGLEP